jgi:vitamin B12 transporter
VNTDDGDATSDTTGERFTVRAKTTYAIDDRPVRQSDQTITGALEWQRETFQANDPDLVFDPSQLDKRERDLASVVLEYRQRFASGLDLQLGLRHDDNDGFKDATTYSAGLSYLFLSTDSRLHASLGTGVKNPTLFEQFGFIPDQFQGNPDLEPENSRGWDVGIEQTFAGGNAVIDLTYFDDRLEDRIATDFTMFPFSPFNEPGTSRRKGLELAGLFTISENLDVTLDYTYLDAKDADGDREVRRPRHEGSLALNYKMSNGRTRLTAAARHVADNLDIDFTAPSFGTERVKLDDYTVVDLAVAHDISPKLELFGRIDNLFDEDYQEINGYAAQPLTFFAGIRGRL